MRVLFSAERAPFVETLQGYFLASMIPFVIHRVLHLFTNSNIVPDQNKKTNTFEM